MRKLPPISSASVGGMGKIVFHIPGMYVIFMGYWMAVQVRTIRSSGIFKNKSKIGFMDLISILVIPCEMFFRIHLNIISIIALVFICWGIVDVCGYAI